MNINEVLPWVLQQNDHLALLHQQITAFATSSHLSSLQAESLWSNLLVISPYLALIAIKPTAARLKVCAALFGCLIVGYLPESWLTNTQFYCSLSLIYLITARFIVNKRIKYSCVIMALFGFIMAVDRNFNAGIETWTYQNYEAITCTIHALIVCSFVKWDRIRISGRMAKLAARLRSLLFDPRIMAPV